MINMSEPAAIESRNQTSQARWDDMFSRLVQYKKQHGDCLVPNRYEEDPQLGAWVSTQRRHYKMVEAGEPSPMTPGRAERLEKLGFKWSAKNPRHLQWETRYQSLLAFKEKYGHVQVPIQWEEDTQLANWVSTQRQEYQNLLKGKTTRLDERRIRLLKNIGFAWQLQRGGRRRNLQARRPSGPSTSGFRIHPADLEAESEIESNSVVQRRAVSISGESKASDHASGSRTEGKSKDTSSNIQRQSAPQEAKIESPAHPRHIFSIGAVPPPSNNVPGLVTLRGAVSPSEQLGGYPSLAVYEALLVRQATLNQNLLGTDRVWDLLTQGGSQQVSVGHHQQNDLLSHLARAAAVDRLRPQLTSSQLLSLASPSFGWGNWNLSFGRSDSLRSSEATAIADNAAANVARANVLGLSQPSVGVRGQNSTGSAGSYQPWDDLRGHASIGMSRPSFGISRQGSTNSTGSAALEELRYRFTTQGGESVQASNENGSCSRKRARLDAPQGGNVQHR